MRPILLQWLLALLLLPACSSPEEPVETASEVPVDTLQVAEHRFFEAYDDALFPAITVDPAEARRWADSTLGTLTLDEKIGQLFIIDLPRTGLRALFSDEARSAVEDYGVGGFLVPRLLRPRTVFDRTRHLQEAARVPLFFAADYERGVGRFDNAFTEFPSNMAVGATRDASFAAATGRLSAIESRAIGVNLLFAPVVDVNNNPDNPIINIRSYGEDPDLVGRMAAAYVEQAQRFGALTTLKHFPGHGDTATDSHADLGVVGGDRAKLDSVELRPYRFILENGVQPAGVMTAHLWIEALEDEPLPATFSRRALTDLLREELGFEGFVVTDDIKMGAVANNYALDERVVQPIRAGADIILTPRDLPRAIEAVRAAVAAGDLDEAAIDRAARRVLEAKARIGLHRVRLAQEEALSHLTTAPHGAALAQAIADRAVTLLKTAPALPLTDSTDVALVQLSNFTDSESIAAAMDTFAAALGTPFTARFRYDRDPSVAASDRVLGAVEGADVVVVALYLRLVSGRGDAGLFRRQTALVRSLLDTGVPVVLVTFGNPYAVLPFDEAAALLVTYDQTIETALATARVLRGERAPEGRLPITVGPYAFGSGLTTVRDAP